MTKGDRCVKIVEWSDEDNGFIGSCPVLFYGGRHGNDAKQVFAELCELVEEAIETLEEAGKPLPPPLSRSEFGSLMQRKPTRDAEVEAAIRVELPRLLVIERGAAVFGA